MATFRFLPTGTTENLKIYVRLSIDKKNVFKRKTDFTINKKIKWSKKTNLPIGKDEAIKIFISDLKKFREGLEDKFNEATANNELINSDWLQKAIDKQHDRRKPENEDRLINYFEVFIQDKQLNGNNKTGEPFAKATFSKYRTVLNKLIAYEKYAKKEIYIKDVDLTFRRDFIKFLANEMQLSKNNYGKHISVIKTVCNDAKKFNIKTSPQLEHIEGARENVESTYLSFEELEKIENTTYLQDYLDNARDWLIIGCYIGQRVSDLLNLTKNNIVYRNGIHLIELTQQKTGKQVFIPVHEKVKQILDKRDGDFPRSLSDQKFNKYIKKVAELAGINQPTKGTVKKVIVLNGQQVVRRIEGTFPKYELIVSHVCRRSFASNYYSLMPTSLLIKITGHSTESEFLKYVKKPPIDFANEIAEYLHTIYQKQQVKNESSLYLSKKAN